MHDSEQEHSGITGCRVTYESTIFYNEANKFSIIVVKTNDPRIPLQACSDRYYGDRMLRFTAVGYELPRTKAVELELDGEWVESKYGYQLQVEQWQEIVPQTADGLLAYLGSGLIKGIGPKTAEDIVATFGPDTLNILDNEPEKLLQIRGITEGKLKDIEESYAESRVLRNLMSLLGPFKITPATALKIYQHFGPACVDILKKCPYDLCQISGFGFKRVDGIVRKTDNRLHSTERIKGAVLYTLEDARSKSGHLFLPSEDLVKETLLLLNAPIPIPEQRVRTEEVQETLQQMILHGAVVAYKQYLYSPRVFGQEDDTARMIAERLANISVAENIESALESVRESLGITLSQKQEQAVRTAFQHGLTIITGSPGTGKTTVLKAIIEVFKNLHPKGKFALMAPTGRASRRMAESTGVDEARTLHSALGLGTGEEVGDGERVRFVDADLVIVDEFSMVDMWLAQQFFKRIGQHMMNRDAEDDAFEVSSDSETVDSFSEEFEPVEPPKPDPQAEDAEEARKKAEFDAAEAKRKAEWEAKQAQKKLREQQELDRLAAMSDDDVMQASMNRVSQDTERLTRRNMKLCVMEDVQTECLADPAFARLVMNPKKKMLNCFHYINRKAREYLEQEMKDNDEKPMGGGFGGDVPDELCYQWAREYFRDAEAKEDAEPEEKFVPKTYNGKMPKAGKVKKDKPKKAAPKPAPKPANEEQLTFGDFGTEEAAG